MEVEILERKRGIWEIGLSFEPFEAFQGGDRGEIVPGLIIDD